MTEILAGGFLPGVKPHWREDSIFDTPCRISSEAYRFVRIESNDRFDQPDGADGEKIFCVLICSLVFADDVRDQAQVSLNKDVFGFQVSFRIFLQVVLLFSGC